MEKVYALVKGMFWKGEKTVGIYRNQNNASEAAIEEVQKYNQAIEGDFILKPLPLTPEVTDEGLYWGNEDDFYVEVVEMDLL